MIDETFIHHIFFNMLKKIRRTRLITMEANVHKRIHANLTTMDDDHILIGTNFTQVLFRKYTQSDAGGCSSMCEEAFSCVFIHNTL